MPTRTAFMIAANLLFPGDDMLLLYEHHKVRGAEEFTFEKLYRDGWLPMLAEGEDARLLWYFHLAHGSNVSYRFITITALRDFAAWERLAYRIQAGDLRTWMAELDTTRYQLDARLLVPLPWSPLRKLDLAATPLAPSEPHELVLYIEDNVRPAQGRIDETIAEARKLYDGEHGEATPGRMSHLVGAFQPFWGAGRRRELVLLSRVDDKNALGDYYATGEHGGSLWPGLAGRPQSTWESHVLRTSSWSPLA